MGLASVLITDPLDPVCGELLEKAGVHVTTKTKLSKDELLIEMKVKCHSQKVNGLKLANGF